MEIFASKGAPPVSTTTVANCVNDTGGKIASGINNTGSIFATSLASVVDTGGKFATGINDLQVNLKAKMFL